MGVQAHRGRGKGQARLAGTAAVCLFAALGLGACGTDHKVPVASSADLAAPASAPAPAVAALPPETSTAPAEAPATPAAEAVDAPAGPSFQAADPADPDEVMGLARGEVEELLGEPGLVRREAPAEVWQYQSGGCVLDVFLYEASAEYEVVYLEARTGKALVAATANCLGAVMDERRRMPTS